MEPDFSKSRAHCGIRSTSAKNWNEIIRCLRSYLQSVADPDRFPATGCVPKVRLSSLSSAIPANRFPVPIRQEQAGTVFGRGVFRSNEQVMCSSETTLSSLREVRPLPYNAPQDFDYRPAAEGPKRVSRLSEVFLGNGGDGVRPDFGRFRQSGLARSQLQTRAPTECRSDGNDDNRRGTRMMVLSVRRNNDHVTQALVGGLDRQFDHRFRPDSVLEESELRWMPSTERPLLAWRRIWLRLPRLR